MSESPVVTSLLDQAKDLFVSRSSIDSPATSPAPSPTQTKDVSDASFESTRSDLVSDGQIQRTGFAHVVTSRLSFFFSQGGDYHRKHFLKVIDVVDAMQFVSKERPGALYIMHAMSELTVALTVLSSDLCRSLEEEEARLENDFNMTSGQNTIALVGDIITTPSFSSDVIIKIFNGCLKTYHSILTYENSVEVRQRRQPSDSDVDSQRNAFKSMSRLLSFTANDKSDVHKEMQSLVEGVISFMLDAISGSFGNDVKKNCIDCMTESAATLAESILTSSRSQVTPGRSLSKDVTMPFASPVLEKDLSNDLVPHASLIDPSSAQKSNVPGAATSTLSPERDLPNALSKVAAIIGNAFFSSSHVQCAQLVEKVLKIKPESLSNAAASLLAAHLQLPTCDEGLCNLLLSTLSLHCNTNQKRAAHLASHFFGGQHLLSFLANRLQSSLPPPTVIDAKPFGLVSVVTHRWDVVVLSLESGGTMFMHMDEKASNQLRDQQRGRLTKEQISDVFNLLDLTSRLLSASDAPLHVSIDTFADNSLRLFCLPEIANATYGLLSWLSCCLETKQGDTLSADGVSVFNPSLFSKASQAVFSILSIPSYRNALLAEPLGFVTLPESKLASKSRPQKPISVLVLLEALVANPSQLIAEAAVAECGSLIISLVEVVSEIISSTPLHFGSRRSLPCHSLRKTAKLCGNCEAVNAPSFGYDTDCAVCGHKLKEVRAEIVNTQAVSNNVLPQFLQPPDIQPLHACYSSSGFGSSFIMRYVPTRDSSDPYGMSIAHISAMSVNSDISQEELRFMKKIPPVKLPTTFQFGTSVIGVPNSASSPFSGVYIGSGSTDLKPTDKLQNEASQLIGGLNFFLLQSSLPNIERFLDSIFSRIVQPPAMTANQKPTDSTKMLEFLLAARTLGILTLDCYLLQKWRARLISALSSSVNTNSRALALVLYMSLSAVSYVKRSQKTVSLLKQAGGSFAVAESVHAQAVKELQGMFPVVVSAGMSIAGLVESLNRSSVQPSRSAISSLSLCSDLIEAVKHCGVTDSVVPIGIAAANESVHWKKAFYVTLVRSLTGFTSPRDLASCLSLPSWPYWDKSERFGGVFSTPMCLIKIITRANVSLSTGSNESRGLTTIDSYLEAVSFQLLLALSSEPLAAKDIESSDFIKTLNKDFLEPALHVFGLTVTAVTPAVFITPAAVAQLPAQVVNKAVAQTPAHVVTPAPVVTNTVTLPVSLAPAPAVSTPTKATFFPSPASVVNVNAPFTLSSPASSPFVSSFSTIQNSRPQQPPNPSIFSLTDILRLLSQTFEGLTTAREDFSMLTSNIARAPDVDRVCKPEFTPRLTLIIDVASKLILQSQSESKNNDLHYITESAVGWATSNVECQEGSLQSMWFNTRTGVSTFSEPVKNCAIIASSTAYSSAAMRVRLLRALLRHMGGSSFPRTLSPDASAPQILKTITGLNATVSSCIVTLLNGGAPIVDGENMCAFLADLLGALSEIEALNPKCIRSYNDYSGVSYSKIARDIVIQAQIPRFAAVGVELSAAHAAWQRLRLEAATLLGEIGLTQEYPYQRCGEAIKDVISLTESALDSFDIIASPRFVRALSGIAGSMETSQALSFATSANEATAAVEKEGSKQLRILVRQSRVVSKLANLLEHLSDDQDRNALAKMIPITSLLLSRVYKPSDAVSGNEFGSAIKITIWMMSNKQTTLDSTLLAVSTLLSLAKSCRYEAVSDRFGEFLRSSSGPSLLTSLLFCMTRARNRLHSEILPERVAEIVDENARYKRSQDSKNVEGFVLSSSKIDEKESSLCNQILKVGANVLDELVKPNPHYDNNPTESPVWALALCFVRIDESVATPSPDVVSESAPTSTTTAESAPVLVDSESVRDSVASNERADKMDKKRILETALQWLTDNEKLDHCDLKKVHLGGSRAEKDVIDFHCRSWSKCSLMQALVMCLRTNRVLRNSYRDSFALSLLTNSIDFSLASTESLLIISDFLAVLASPEKLLSIKKDSAMISETSTKRQQFLDNTLLSTIAEAIRSSKSLQKTADLSNRMKISKIRINILSVCKVLITEPGRALPLDLLSALIKNDLPREVELSKKLDGEWVEAAKTAADELASAQQAYKSMSSSAITPFIITEDMKSPPLVDHSVLITLLDILNTATAFTISTPTSRDDRFNKSTTAMRRDLSASLASSNVIVPPTVPDNLLSLGHSVLDILSESSIKILLSSITISSEQVVKLALVLLSSTLYSIEAHSEMRAFRRDLYVPVYEILADENKPSASRAAAAAVISVALDNCRDDAEVEELCGNLAAVSPKIKSKPVHLHTLFQIVSDRNCDICGKDVSSSWSCKPCDYDECNDCYLDRKRPPLKPVELLSRLVTISSGLDSTEDSARHDLSAAMPTLYVAIQAIGKLLDSGGERGKAFKKQAQAFDLSDKILRAGDLASKAGGGRSSDEAEMGERVFRIANALHARHFMSQDREHHLVEFEHPDEVKQRALESVEIKQIALEAAEAAAKAKAESKEVDDELTTFMSEAAQSSVVVSPSSSSSSSSSTATTSSPPPIEKKKKSDSIQLPLANRIRGLVPVLLETRILPPKALKQLVEMLELVASRSISSTSVPPLDPYATADSKLRKGVFAILKKDYKTAYESCDQSDDKRGLIYSALAQLKNGWDPVEPKRRLNEYNHFIETTRDDVSLDPVVLYVMYVLHTQLRPIQQHREIATLYLKAFELFEVSSLWLGPKDNIEQVIKSSKGDDFIADDADDPSGPKAMWDLAKLRKGAKSSAMDELMCMVGLKKIKQEAFSFWSSVELAKSRPKEANAGLNRNFVFLGNPGTGKTVVAEILSRALSELGVRLAPLPSGFHKLSGAEALRDGPAEFKKLLTRIEGGTLFLDEVYQLQPKQNNDGRDIMNLLLTFAEEKRETTTILLAGYMDDINDLLSFNPGLASRFPNMWTFEDYNERELQLIFEKMVSDRAHLLSEHTPSISRVVAARLSKGRGMPGFANARAVRNIVDASCKRLSERLAPRIIDGATGSVGSADGLKKEDLVTLSREDVLGEKPDLENTPELAELRRLTGLEEVKEKVIELMHLQMANFDREQRGEKTLDIPLHRIFYGKPGTGKTTVAKIFGRLLKRFGFLSNGDVVVKGPADFLGDVVGSSEKKTIDILESCRGKVLVLDECYALNPKRGGNSFAGNVIDTLVQRVQGTPGEDIAIILCGYEDEVNALLRDANPGLSRRFRSEDAFRFADYNNAQLTDIMREKVRMYGLSITLPTAQGAIAIVSRERAKPNFGNAGAVENLLSRAKERMQTRLTKALAEHRREAEVAAAAAVAAEERRSGGALKFGGSESGNAKMAARIAASSTSVINQSLLVLEDFDKNPASFDCVKKILDDLVGVEFIHEYFEEVEASVEDAKAEGRDPQVIDHLVFSGPPGVGKSTVASRFGNILYACGLLPSDTIVKQSGRTLQDRYIGGTQAKVQETMRSALGGVLFIDEAGGLGGSGRENDFLKEAVGTMLQLMNTDEYKGKIMIILADTDDNIDALFDVNAAFSSRFSKRIRFNAWDSKQAASVCEKTLSLDRIELDNGALDALEEGCERLMERPGWANGRTVKDILLTLVKKKRALRRNRAAKLAKETTGGGTADLSSSSSSSSFSSESSKSVLVDDVTAALTELIPKPKSRSVPKVSSASSHLPANDGHLWSTYLPPEAQSLRSTAVITRIDSKSKAHTHKHSDKKEEAHDEEDEENVDEFESFEERLEDLGDSEIDEQYAIQEMGLCVAGYPWDLLPSGGYICQGGSHRISATQVKSAVDAFKKSGKSKNPKIWKS